MARGNANNALSGGRGRRRVDLAPDGKKIFYVDGYHGGTEGHLPLGCMQSILSFWEQNPDWKISLELEPHSWDTLRQRDPETYARYCKAVGSQPYYGRMEFVSGSYAQPYCWNIGGESNIRQLVKGRELLRSHFPDVVIDTYAVQEPCWTSALPQILRSLGYRRAVLKDPSTAFAGYTQGIDSHLIDWVGPDGTSIPAVPRYACERLLIAWATDGRFATPSFVERCHGHGLTKPAGMAFQDTGWLVRPRVSGPHVQYVTWREYVDTIAPRNNRPHVLSQEHFQVALAWGSRDLSNLAHQARCAEEEILRAEILSSMAVVSAGAQWNTGDFDRAWHALMMSQHHDAWICALSPHRLGTWGAEAIANAWHCRETAAELSGRAIAGLSSPGGGRAPSVLVTNTLSVKRTDLISAQLSLPAGSETVRVYGSADQEIQSQIVPLRRGANGEVEAACVLFRDAVPSMGWRHFRLAFSSAGSHAGPPASMEPLRVCESDSRVEIETDLYAVSLDKRRGGTVDRLILKSTGKNFVNRRQKRAFNELRGFFPLHKAWHSTVDRSAEVTVVESGPIRIRLRVAARLGPFPVVQEMSFVKGEQRIDCSVQVTFDEETELGEPWKGDCDRRRRRKPCYDSRYKLQVLFPPALGPSRTVDRDAPYDVCRSGLRDTFYNSWRSLKNDCLFQWVDVGASDGSHGLAIFSDRVSSYSHGPRHPLGLVLAWAGRAFWNKYYPLRGTLRCTYAVVPHAKGWREAAIPAACTRWRTPLVGYPSRMPDTEPTVLSVVGVSPVTVDIPAMYVCQGVLFIRVFNWGPKGRCRVVVPVRTRRATLVELDGREVRALKLSEAKGGKAVAVTLPQFGLATVACVLSRRAGGG